MAGDVTARQVDGQTVLSVRSWPTGPITNKQAQNRANFAMVAKSYRTISDEQMKEWDRLAQHATGQSVLGQKAKLSGFNLYVRHNLKQTNQGGAISFSAPQLFPDDPYEIDNP